MNKQARVFLVLFFIILGLWFYVQKNAQTTDGQVGHVIPTLHLLDEAGAKITVSPQSNKLRLIHFWASWCSSCVPEIPLLNSFMKKMVGTPLELVAISMDNKSQDVVSFRKKIPFTFRIFFDPHMEAADNLGTYMLPETYLVSKQGVILHKFVGPQDWDNPHIEAEIRKNF
ncbi:MAG: hypothetical protein A3G32_09985 [Deltaproteobacteria bacterium RIFCSPLOWO2_12_FULL_40_28]|nr:MAG: hypothetical protein A3C45_04995 [Deltaproteobacteria bacterium RIFCSPHIGHO2_02_FULL_40_28]OGQ20361.1 MAG: hypothetical protein A3E27_00375 [Deltaproteobacteria bacterium RIFCSPHIGHO2_12_FULL_40_32]OGQ41330.1 MAG: hypothetical protein A3I69_02025 [Deltaproteobacteria bacterium RIFCSPLOWO2_02_FULL_40_36]OGQ54969.1 MAG: hypothetical protein A3G32_09985 [Deltaproteobacteria bacterium RIFCSPLOWO2_12_FULL_40_28]